MNGNPFVEAAREAFRRTKSDFVREVIGGPDRPGGAPSPDSVAVGKEGGSSLADLMYAFGRGGKEQLIERATEKFRASSVGQEIEQEAKTQAVQDVIRSPTFIVTSLAIATGILLLIGVFAGRAGR